MRPSALFPMACAIVGFVLSMLCLFAGHKAGFMEDYAIMTVRYLFPTYLQFTLLHILREYATDFQ